jgi:choline dehydrogenase-like flavoprotein
VTDRYDVVVVGSGFAGSFFLKKYLERASPRARVLVLERGGRRDHQWQMKNRRTPLLSLSDSSWVNKTPSKPWVFSLALGGGSNCWWACTPRMLPADFETFARYGVGHDWPIRYADLERFYTEAEEIMQVAGSQRATPFPMSRRYPLPPHAWSRPDERLKRAFPDLFFPQPTARASRPVEGQRPKCCNNGVCTLCPINAKFTVQNGLPRLFEDPRVTLLLEATALTVETAGGAASGVVYRRGGREQRARGELIVLAANAIFNPFLLLRSGLASPLTGKGLNEQMSIAVDVHLDGLDNFQGGTVVTGHGYTAYDGEHRRARAPALIETGNAPALRLQSGKWRQRVKLKVLYEEHPGDENQVTADPSDPERPVVSYRGPSEYCRKGLAALRDDVERFVAPLPVEQILYSRELNDTESHILGTTRMSTASERGVVDRHLFHHQARNLLVLGGSVFPTSAPANPTLTICAMALRAAEAVGAPA